MTQMPYIPLDTSLARTILRAQLAKTVSKGEHPRRCCEGCRTESQVICCASQHASSQSVYSRTLQKVQENMEPPVLKAHDLLLTDRRQYTQAICNVSAGVRSLHMPLLPWFTLRFFFDVVSAPVGEA